MASKLMLALSIMAAVTAPAFGTDYIVGDSSGWGLGVNYTAWAQGKIFNVGDTIQFKYFPGAHNVYKVNGTAFQQCLVPPPSEALHSGADVITLATPGKKWYICGVGSHCGKGMKLVITVYSNTSFPLPSSSPSPSPSPSPANGAPEMRVKKPIRFGNNWKLKIHF